MAIDVLIYEEGSGGEFTLVNDDLSLTNGLANQVYLALFGGNLEQSTSLALDELDTRSDWWGNVLLSEETQFNSSFERALSEVTINSAGRAKLEAAAAQDLDYLKEYADISLNSEVAGVNKLELYVTLQEPGKESIKIKLLWDGTRNEAIINVLL